MTADNESELDPEQAEPEPDLSQFETQFGLAQAQHDREVVSGKWALSILRMGADGVNPHVLFKKTPPDVVHKVALAGISALRVLSQADDLKVEAQLTMEELIELVLDAAESNIPPESQFRDRKKEPPASEA